MKKASKGTIIVSTNNNILIKKMHPFSEFTWDNVKQDLTGAASAIGFKNENGDDIVFELDHAIDRKEFDISYKEISCKMTNFSGVSFKDSFKDASPERKDLFKNWSKFWSHLSKMGYTIK